MQYTFKSELWLYPGNGAWVFATVSRDISEEVKALTSGSRRGFGSLRVAVTVNNVAWETSIFPDSKRGAYLLPVKKAVRVSAGIEPGDICTIHIRLKDW